MPGPSEDEVVTDLRATLLSSKDPLRLQDVNSDYKLVNGSDIPFKAFGYKSLEEFLTKLQNEGKVTIKREGGNILVHAMANASSAHVQALIKKQKPSKKKRPSFGRYKPQGQGRRPNRVLSYQSHQSYRGSAVKGNGGRGYGASSHQSYYGSKTNGNGGRGCGASSHQSYYGSETNWYGGRGYEASSHPSYYGSETNWYGGRGCEASSYQNERQSQTNQWSWSNDHESQAYLDQIYSSKGWRSPSYEFWMHAWTSPLFDVDPNYRGHKKMTRGARKKPQKNPPQNIMCKPKANVQPLMQSKVQPLMNSTIYKPQANVQPLMNNLRLTNCKPVVHNSCPQAVRQIKQDQKFSVQERLKRLNINLDPDPKPPLPAYLSQKENIPSPPSLIPPKSSTWDIFVSVAKSTTEVWIKLIGEDYSDKCADLSDEMALSFADFEAEDHVASPKIGHYYAVKDEDLWYRVKLLSIKDDSCECHLIDTGEKDIFTVNQLFCLDPLFLDLPAQAFKCSIHNLEKYADSLQSQPYLNVIEGNIFVGQVITSEEPYSIELYDTSSEENMHMNEFLLVQLDAANSAPSLPPVGHIQPGDIKTYVSFVSETGEIGLQFHTPHYLIIEELIDSITPEEETLYRVTKLADVTVNRPYLVQFSDDGWGRGIVTNMNSEDDVEIYSMDFGDSYSVSMQDLMCLEKLPLSLSLIRPQAIVAHLDSLPPNVFTENIADKLRELIPEDKEVLVKTITEGDIPVVELFIRMEPSNLLASVNNTILMDSKLTKS